MKSRALFSPEPHRGWLPWGALAPILGFLFVALPSVPIDYALEGLGLSDQEGPIGFRGMAALALLAFSAVGLVMLAWVRFVERRPFATIGLTRPGGLGKFVRGHLVGCASILAVLVATWLAGGYVATAYAPAWHSVNAVLSIAALLLCFAIQASVEEIVFRGWMLSAIARKFNVAWGVGLSSLIFVALHISPRIHWLDIVNLVLFALFACAWALKKNSIWGIMGWHAGWNWLLCTGFQLPVTGMDVKLPALLVALTPQGSAYLTGGHQGPEGSLACTAFLGCGIAFLLKTKRQ